MAVPELPHHVANQEPSQAGPAAPGGMERPPTSPPPVPQSGVGMDRFAVATLLLELPSILLSVVLVLTVGGIVGASLGSETIGRLVMLGLWLASAALIFQRPVETFLARFVVRARRPIAGERSRLEPLWREVTAAAGVEGEEYQLWIVDSDDLNASAISGHVVTVTRRAIEVMPPRHLAAVLAHELGHHVGGHAWSAMLAAWYALPGRLVVRLALAVGRLLATLYAAVLSGMLVFTRLGVFGALFFRPLRWLFAAFMLVMYFPLVVIAVVPMLILRMVDRYGELRADVMAAKLGYGPDLVVVFETWLRSGMEDEDQGITDRLLATHPPLPKRIDRLNALLSGGA